MVMKPMIIVIASRWTTAAVSNVMGTLYGAGFHT